MKTFKILAILVILSAVVFTVSAINQKDFANNLFKPIKNSDQKINLEDMINSAKVEEKQISQNTKDIAKAEVMQKVDEMKEDSSIPIIIWGNKDYNIESTLDSIEGLEIKYIYDQFNGAAAKATKEAINMLNVNKGIDYIAFDQVVQADLFNSGPLIQSNTVHSNYNITGQGVGVCHLDTGINYNHINLAGAYTGGYDFVNNDADPLDDNGHGTLTAGVIASDDLFIRGISPGVDLLAVKVLDSSGSGSFSNVIAGINWCIANKNLYNIGVISMSLGTNGANSTFTPSTSPGYAEPALFSAYIQHIVPVASSGNEGSLTGISYPAVSPYVISVASSYNSAIGTINHSMSNSSCIETVTNPDKLSCFSNRAPFVSVVAPGCNIVTTLISGGFGPATCGTSMAAPHVSGTIALMKQRNFQAKVEQIRNNLNKTGVPIYDNATGLTFSRVNALNAVQAIPFISITGTLGAGNTMYMNISDPLNAGLIYITALSWGNSPGIPLPNGLTLPLNYDVLLQVSSGGNAAYVNNVGILDSNGKAMATFYVPNITGIENWTIYSGFTDIDFNRPELFVSVSNAARLLS